MAERLALPGSGVHMCSSPQQTSVLQVAGKGVRTIACGTAGWKPQNIPVREACGECVGPRRCKHWTKSEIGHGVETLEGQGKCLCQLGQSGWWQ